MKYQQTELKIHWPNTQLNIKVIDGSVVYIIISYMCIIFSNEPKYCACFYVNNVLYVYNCIHEKAIKPTCNLVILSSVGRNPSLSQTVGCVVLVNLKMVTNRRWLYYMYTQKFIYYPFTLLPIYYLGFKWISGILFMQKNDECTRMHVKVVIGNLGLNPHP